MEIDCLPGGTSGAKWQRAHVGVAAALCCLLALFAGCGETAKSLTQTVRGSVMDGPALPISPSEVAGRPLFQMLAQSNEGKALLILGNVEGTREIWYGPRGSAVVLDRGRVTKTANLATNLESVRVVGRDPFATGLNHVESAVLFDSVEDWSPGYHYGDIVHSVLTRGNVETLRILGKAHNLLRIDEQRRSTSGWSAQSHYWVDPDTGFIWKSEQTLAPGLTLTLLQLKPRLQGGP